MRSPRRGGVCSGHIGAARVSAGKGEGRKHIFGSRNSDSESNKGICRAEHNG